MAETPLERYIAHAKVHGEASETGDYKTGNKAYKQKHIALAELRKLPDRGEAALMSLLDHPHLWVRESAATHLLPLREELACAALEQMLMSSNKHVADDAKMVLQEWRNGRLKSMQ
jgi:hypothetical protein